MKRVAINLRHNLDEIQKCGGLKKCLDDGLARIPREFVDSSLEDILFAIKHSPKPLDAKDELPQVGKSMRIYRLVTEMMVLNVAMANRKWIKCQGRYYDEPEWLDQQTHYTIYKNKKVYKGYNG